MTTETLKKVGDTIRANRKELGMSQRKFADHSSFTLSFISSLERGLRNPSLLTIIRLAEAFNMPVSKLLEGF